MNDTQALQETLYWFYSDFIRSFSYYLPKLLAALLIFIFGTAIAKVISQFFTKTLELISLSKLIKDTPVDHFLQRAEVKKVENAIGKVVYYLLMLVVLHSTVAMLGLEPLSNILDKLLAYIPRIISAVIVLLVGIILAGFVETLVKASIKSLHSKSARVLGKVSSYLVLSLGVLIAISELGIASNYILILFIGFVVAVSLGFALAFGLGAKDLVSQLLSDWYKNTKNSR